MIFCNKTLIRYFKLFSKDLIQKYKIEIERKFEKIIKNVAEVAVTQASYVGYLQILTRLDTDPTFKIPWTMSQIESSLNYFNNFFKD